MVNLKGSKTEEILKFAFAGESQAHTKYQYYASQAKKDGYVQIKEIFEETARNEKEHAKLWFKYLHDDGVPSTPENLQDAIDGEHHEWSEMYLEFAEVAREEGFDEIADRLECVGKIEKEHEGRYQKLLNNIKDDSVFVKDEEIEWKCGNCGYIHKGAEAPEECPACAHPKSYFEIRAQNY